MPFFREFQLMLNSTVLSRVSLSPVVKGSKGRSALRTIELHYNYIYILYNMLTTTFQLIIIFFQWLTYRQFIWRRLFMKEHSARLQGNFHHCITFDEDVGESTKNINYAQSIRGSPKVFFYFSPFNFLAFSSEWFHSLQQYGI